MSSVEALNSQDITKIGLGVIAAIVVIGFLLSLLLTAIVARILILIVVIALGAFVWQQRTHIKDEIAKCHLDATFFGVHVKAPQSVLQECRKQLRG